MVAARWEQFRTAGPGVISPCDVLAPTESLPGAFTEGRQAVKLL